MTGTARKMYLIGMRCQIGRTGRLPFETPDDGDFRFGALDLSNVQTLNPNEHLSEWDRTAKYVHDKFPNTNRTTGAGNGRSDRVMRCQQCT